VRFKIFLLWAESVEYEFSTYGKSDFLFVIMRRLFKWRRGKFQFKDSFGRLVGTEFWDFTGSFKLWRSESLL